MGKRRKVSAPSTSTVSSPRMRVEVKEENPYLEGDMALGVSAGEMASARNRLRGALQDALEHSDSESVSSEDQQGNLPQRKKEPSGTGGASGAASASGAGAQALRNLRQQQRRRRRRELLSESAFHHTYVMKLFDRSVDLAQFPEDTPLYPVCRAWMANQPHNTNLVPKLRTPTPEPPPEESVATPEAASGASASGADGDDASGQPAEGDEDGEEMVRDTYRMPPPRPLPEDPEERRRLRVPSPPLRVRSLDHDELILDYDAKPPTPRDVLLQEHIEHWTAVRKKWHEATRRNQSRFEASARILKAIYRKAQKAYE